MRRIVLGTRGSELARAQTVLVEGALRNAHSDVEVALEIITTRGDQQKSDARSQLASHVCAQVGDLHHGRKGLFTSEIEHALLEHRIDVAVHSAKDLPSDPTAGLEICATLSRGTVEDVLITKSGEELASLPAGSTIGTGSVRRQHQLRWLRADLTVVELRGNVPTRLRKLIANPWEAIILARAGLERLGYDCSRGELVFAGHKLRAVILPVEEFLPAGGQGIVALQTRADDEQTRGVLASTNHAETLLCLRVEREFLRLLQGDCGTPVGVLATLHDRVITIRAQLFDNRHAEPRAATLRSERSAEQPEALAAELLELING